MRSKFLKISLFLSTFIFLSGFLPFSSILGPGLTIASSGNVLKAGAQLLIDNEVKKKTGKNSLEFVREEVSKKNLDKDMNVELRNLVEARIKITHKKLTLIKQHNDINDKLIQIIEKRVKITHKKLKENKFNQLYLVKLD